MDTAVLGLGKFGSVHAKELKNLGYLRYVIDIDGKKKKEVEKLKAKFLNLDLTEFISIERNKEDNPLAHKIKKDLSELKEFLTNIKIWHIATPTPTHFPLMLLGLEFKKDIFVEKPPAEKVSEIDYILKRFSRAKIGVDYIEMAHPVVRAIKDRMIKEKFRPAYFFNHRSKDLRGVSRGLGGGEGSRVVLEELVHDLSEIDFFRKCMVEKPFSKDLPKVTEVQIQTWKELDKNYLYSTDVRAKFSLIFNDGVIANIEGGFADPEVRQFLIINKDGETAFYGNTLARKIISPIAAKIVGKENIEYLLQKIKTLLITTDKAQKEILSGVKAKILIKETNKYVPQNKWRGGKPMYGLTPAYIMIKNFHQAKSKKDLICSLDQALEYQKIAEEVYKIAGKPEAIVYQGTGNQNH